jgi:APA family basic amino acid/polyamine antiporter
MSAVMLVLFISAISAMMLVGPRVYSAMAHDGVLPRALAAKPGKPPTVSVVLQGAIAIALLFTHDLRTVLSNVGAIVVFFAALTVSGLFAARLKAVTEDAKPSLVSLVGASIYVVSAAWMLFQGFKNSLSLLAWVGLVAAAALGAWALTRTLRAKQA